MDLRICPEADCPNPNMYLRTGLCLPNLKCLHLWDFEFDHVRKLKHMDWGAALPKLLSLHVKPWRYSIVLTSLPPMLMSLKLCLVDCSDFRECVHLKRLKVDGERLLRYCKTVLLPASLELLVFLQRGYIRLGQPLPGGLRILVNAASGIDFAGSRPSMFARPTVLQVQPDGIVDDWGDNLQGPFDFDNMPAAWLDAQGSDEFWDSPACIEGVVGDA